MRRAGLICAPLVLSAALFTTRAADPPPAGPVAFRGAHILTAAGKPIDNGVLVIDRGKIAIIK